jgi:hypothetical protein
MREIVTTVLACSYLVFCVAIFLYWLADEWHSYSATEMYEQHGAIGWIIHAIILALSVVIIIAPMEIIVFLIKLLLVTVKAIEKVWHNIFKFRLPYMKSEIKMIRKHDV